MLVHNATQNGSCSVEANIPDDYTKDKDGRYHRPNGQYASNSEIGLPITQKPINSNGIHGNSLQYPGKNYGYVLKDVNSGEILKYGESINPNTRYTQKELNSWNAKMYILTESTKADVHYWQIDFNNIYKQITGNLSRLTVYGN